MQAYKLVSILNVFFIYFIAFIPTFFILLNKKNYSNKNIFLKKVSLSIFIETLLFIFIYNFAEEIAHFISSKSNIQNYTVYILKILFVASNISGIHFAIPIYFFLNKYTKKGITLFTLKMLYLPIMFLGFIFFNTKGIFFAVPLCDILYSVLLVLYFKFNT